MFHIMAWVDLDQGGLVNLGIVCVGVATVRLEIVSFEC